mmetsp:Transcript_41715/g.76804  ORF Transcript_41715/g.76804 Transcript_41715/m.76804 type:complete len:89 (-) Transcript_41715:3-269(-)
MQTSRQTAFLIEYQPPLEVLVHVEQALLSTVLQSVHQQASDRIQNIENCLDEKGQQHQKVDTQPLGAAPGKALQALEVHDTCGLTSFG